MQEITPTHYFGAAGETSVSPCSLVLFCIALALIFLLPRRKVALPLIAACILIPMPQQIIVAGLHITLRRILILAGFMRALGLRSPEKPLFRWNSIDTAVLCFYSVYAVTFFLLWGELGALVNRAGLLYDVLGLYFLIRCFVPEISDVDLLVKMLSVLLIVIAGFMLVEHLKGYNYLSILGVRPIPEIREGRFRAQGPFANTLTAGTCIAALFPLQIGLFWQSRRDRTLAVLGACASLIVSFTTAASTPVLTLVSGTLALCMWKFRANMRWLRWGVLLTLISLHIVMNGPVWSLIGRIDLTGSSSSYHRYELVNQTINRFGEWWLFGTRNTVDWGWDMWDTANYYVEIATQGGLISLVLFFALLTVAFRQLGIARKASVTAPLLARRFWVLGSVMFAQAVGFFGISYFDQSSTGWSLTLGIIANCIALAPSASSQKVPQTAVAYRNASARAELDVARAFRSKIARAWKA